MAGALQTLDNPSNDRTYRMQTLFSKKLLTPMKENLVRAQFAQTSENVRKNAGSLTLRFFKRRPADDKDIVTLSEGVPITTYTEVSFGHVDVTLVEIGQAAKISDLKLDVDIFDLLNQHVQTLGEDAALKADKTIATKVVAGMADSDNGFERFAVASPTWDSSADFTTLAAADATASKITRLQALSCATQLMDNKVPTINGTYVAVVGPRVMHDIRQDEDWLDAAKFSDVQKLYKRETVTLDGVRYVETTVPWRENAYGTYAAAGVVHTTEFYGAGAFGCPKMTGWNDPWAPKMTILNQADKSDMLNQYCAIGWKALWNAVLLKVASSAGNNSFTDVPSCVLLRTKSTFASA